MRSRVRSTLKKQAPQQNLWVKMPVRTGLCPEPRGFGRHGTGMLMLPFGCACAASLDEPSPGMNESEKSCVPSLLWVQGFNPWVQVFNPWVQVFNLHMPSTRWSLVAPRATGNEPSGVTQRRFSHGCLARLASQHGRKPTRMSLFLQSPIGFSFRRERIWQKVPV